MEKKIGSEDECEEKDEGSVFLRTFRKSLKINEKNVALRKRAKALSCGEGNRYMKQESSELTEKAEEKKMNSMAEDLELPVRRLLIIEHGILKGSDHRNVIPDIQFIEADQKLIYKPLQNWSPEELFELGKLCWYRKNYQMSLDYLSKAEKANKSYKTWNIMVNVSYALSYNDKKQKESGFCCTTRQEKSKKDLIQHSVNSLSKQKESIETLWILMLISLSNILFQGVNIEPSRYYAGKIKKIDNFYGYLAWSLIYYHEGNNPNASQLLLELITVKSNRPEAYYLAWIFFFQEKEYEKALEIAIEAFIKVNSSEFEDFYIIFCLKLAKSYYYTGKFMNCIDLLYTKFLEHPDYPVFLYHLSKFCILSEDFAFSGISKGLLRELLRICDDSRKGSIYYWLVKAYLLTRQLPEAFKYSVKAMKCLDKHKKEKFSEIRQVFLELQPMRYLISDIKANIKARRRLKDSLKDCEQLEVFHKPTAELLRAEICFHLGEKVEAVNLLRAMISTSRLEIAAFIKLLEFDPNSSESTYKSLLSRVKSTQMPIQAWVKSTLAYSKYLFSHNFLNKCFFTLRSISKLLPPLPQFSLPYCQTLKSSDDLHTFSGLANPDPAQQEINLPNQSKSHLKLPNSRFNPNSSSIESVQTLNILKIDTDFQDSPLPLPTILSPKIGSTRNFSLCSKSKFLYYISKFSYLSKRNIVEGLLAIEDYKKLLQLTSNPQRRSRLINKADLVKSKLESLKHNNKQNFK